MTLRDSITLSSAPSPLLPAAAAQEAQASLSMPVKKPIPPPPPPPARGRGPPAAPPLKVKVPPVPRPPATPQQEAKISAFEEALAEKLKHLKPATDLSEIRRNSQDKKQSNNVVV